MVSTRWSYGPDGLRERPIEQRRAVVEYLPRWRELQPILLRSAGIVGLVATIMAVVSSDALHLGGEPGSLEGDGALAVTVDTATYEPPKVASAEGEIIAASRRPAEPEIQDLRTDAAPAPPATDPATTASVDAAAKETAPGGEGQVLAPAVADLRSTVPEQALPAAEAPVRTEEAPVGGPLEPPVDEALLAEPPTASPEAATASPDIAAAPHQPAPSPVSASADAQEEIELASLEVTAAPAEDEASERFDWATGAEECLRDWLQAEQGSDGGSNCTTTDVLIAAIEENEQPALQEAATEQAELLALLAPLPRPRPEPPADFKPSNPHTTRVSSNRSSSWPSEPPPACPGQHAKWRFVDRKAGTKEWYCR